MAKDRMASTLRFLLAARRSELHGLEVLASTCELVVLVSALVHALQKERGYSNLYLYGADEQPLAALTGLSRDAIEVEEGVRRFLDELESDAARSAEKARLLNCVAYALYRLDELPDMRRRLRDRRIPAEEANAAFTRLIGSLLAVVFEAADSALDPGVTRILVALLNFMQGKELSGQERACGVIGYRAGYFTDAMKARMQALDASQARCFDVFAQYAPDEALAGWSTLAPLAQPVVQMRNMARNTSDAHRVDGGLAELWFDVCTQRMDAMRAVESTLATALARQCDKRIAETREEMDNRRLLLERFAEHASGKTTSMLFNVQGRVVDVPPSDGVGQDMERSILDVMREQTLHMQRSEEALAAVRTALDERKRIEKAKWLLVSRYALSEQAAHERMQKAAMDGGMSFGEVARQILTELGER